MEKQWASGPAGRFALNLQMRLLQQSLAAWPRRGARLLEVNCGEGLFLPLLWECGFDVVGTERMPGLREQAAINAAAKAEVEAAADDHLPFEDNAFDWVVLHALAADAPALAASVNEALRVAARGLAVTFWNTASLPGLCRRLSGGAAVWPAPGHNWWRVWRLLRGYRTGRLTSLSTLAGPMRTWNRQCPVAPCNAWLRGLPLGAWSIIRLDLTPLRPVTPLALRLGRARLRRPEPALECVQKNLASPLNKRRKNA
ncbi:methyltransferase domain-containing protein [uncultured Desulfovibrio sp.]|uniref:class I SAM-dependent methyltransferase n=1 Tax=uncultured Desulfovibrio sp. TaxID=167968 RepID=UPI0026161EE9|nr:methyltransferase domain-containing protein [uncultured Desulfovibrio sp.]